MTITRGLRGICGLFDCGGQPMDPAEIKPGDQYHVFKKWHTVTTNMVVEGLPACRLGLRDPKGETFTVDCVALCTCQLRPGGEP